MSSPAIITAVLYLAGCTAIAAWATTRTRDERDFYAAGRDIGPWTLGVASMAATLSGFVFIGGPGLMQRTGAGALYIVLPAACTAAMSAWALARRLRLLAEVRGVLTIPEAIAARYRSPAAQGLAAVAIVAACGGYLATNFLALGVMLSSIFTIDRNVAIAAGAAAVVAYSVAGGIKAGVYTDVFQGAIMAVASALVFAAALASGGGLGGIMQDIARREPALVGAFGTMPPLAALSLFFVFSLGVLGQPHVIHKYYMVRDPRDLRWYPLIMTAAMLVTLLLMFGVGFATSGSVLAGRMPPLARPDDATPRFLLAHASPWLAGLVFSGVAAAIMSTANSFINVAAAAMTRDIPAALGRSPSGLGWGRVASLAIASGAVAIALWTDALVAFLGVFGWGLFAATLVPSLALGLAWTGATRAGAIASIITAIVTTFLVEGLAWGKVITLPAGVSAAGMTMVASLLVFVGVSWLTRARAARDLDPDIRLVMDA